MRAFALAVGVCALLVAAAHAADPSHVAAGRHVAAVNCGGCHGIGAGPSPLADAPPFVRLHERYPAGGLDELLQRGMLADRNREEAGPKVHPRMPNVALDPDQTADLKAYLRSLEPALP